MGAALNSLTSLRTLQLCMPGGSQHSRSEQHAAYFSSLAQLTMLTKLDLRYVDPEALAQAQYLPISLVELKLQTWAVTDMPSTVQLGHLTAVTSLDIDFQLASDSCSLPPFTLHALMRVYSRHEVASLSSSLSHLQTCSLWLRTPDSARHVSLLTSLTSLTCLELSSPWCSDVADMAPTWRSLPALRALEFWGDDDDAAASQAFTAGIYNYLTAASTLTRLEIFYDDEIFPGGHDDVKDLCAHVAQLQQLQYLHLAGLPLLGTVRHLTQLTQLTTLNLYDSQVSDLAAVALGIGLKNLVSLELSYNADLSDACAPALAQLTGLKELGLVEVPGFTEEGLRELSRLKKLQKLRVDEEDLAGGALEALWAAIRQ